MPDPLRVGYVLKRYPRLSETFIVREILALEARGVEVEIFALGMAAEGRFHRDLASVRAQARYLPAGTSDLPAALRQIRPGEGGYALEAALDMAALVPPKEQGPLLIQGLHAARLARSHKLDHLHAHFMTGAARVAYIAHLFTGIPFTVTAHAKDIFHADVDPDLFRRIAEAAHAVVTVSDYNRDFITRRLLSGSKARVERIYNGLRLRPRLAGSPREPGLILAVGRLVEKKGVDVLLHSCALLRERGVPFRAVIIGDGEERQSLEALRRSLGLEMVAFIGPQPDEVVSDWMQRAALLAAPFVVGSDGDQDALPTVLIEALSHGTPVVAGRVGGVPEIVADGVEGYVIGPGEPDRFADAVAHLLDNPGLGRTMGAAGPAKVAAHFDSRATSAQLEALWTERAPELAVI